MFTMNKILAKYVQAHTLALKPVARASRLIRCRSVFCRHFYPLEE